MNQKEKISGQTDWKARNEEKIRNENKVKKKRLFFEYNTQTHTRVKVEKIQPTDEYFSMIVQ